MLYGTSMVRSNTDQLYEEQPVVMSSEKKISKFGIGEACNIFYDIQAL